MDRPRKIQEVLEVETGLVRYADEVFSGTREESHTLRNTVEDAHQRGEVLFTCLICKQPVYVAGTPNQDYTFKHRHELGDCPIKTKSKFSQDDLDRMRFNGVKEGRRHREIKAFVWEYARGQVSKEYARGQVSKKHIQWKTTRPVTDPEKIFRVCDLAINLRFGRDARCRRAKRPEA